MKLFFMSDIHGSSYYLKKALEAFYREKAEHIIILGDALYHGPRNCLPKDYNPKEVIEILNNLKSKIISVRGNCDSEVDQMVINYPMMSDYNILFYHEKKIFLTHGHIYNKDNMPRLNKGDILVYGHTHIPVAEIKEDIFIINPGSISLPKENTPNCYGVLEENNFYIKTLEGEIYKQIKLNLI